MKRWRLQTRALRQRGSDTGVVGDASAFRFVRMAAGGSARSSHMHHDRQVEEEG
jgi:hypothetical protein